jgi:hypothetical protein
MAIVCDYTMQYPIRFDAVRRRVKNPEAAVGRIHVELCGAEWDASKKPAWLTREAFSQQIQPLLADTPTSTIRSGIDVSRWYAGRIRQGYCPHPRHWQALAKLVGVSADVPKGQHINLGRAKPDAACCDSA